MAWKGEEIREVIWCYMYCRKYLTHNYNKVYEMVTMKSRLYDVHGCKETHKPEKPYHEEQKDYRDGD